MLITIDNKTVEIKNGETVLEAAERIGCVIPALCYAKGAKHKSSCMVCAVKNVKTGQIIPSCSTMPVEGMQIETESEEVLVTRSMSLELLLSDHRADCEAPCVMVCPKGLDIEKMLLFYDGEDYRQAHAVIAGAFDLPEIGCVGCKAACEKACRRAAIDKSVDIRTIIKEVVEMFDQEKAEVEKSQFIKDKTLYHSKLVRFSDDERERLIRTVNTRSRCLHCACAGGDSCKLREYATGAGISRRQYGQSSAQMVMSKMHIKDNMWFEESKCIRCGLCVYNSTNGFTFKGRGFEMQVVLPPENKENISEELVKLCPTGAIYLSQ